MSSRKFIFAIATLTLLFGCKAQKSMNKTDLLTRGKLKTTLDTAVVVIPIEARVSDIQQFIEGTFKEFEFGQPTDDTQVKAIMRPGVEIDVDTDSLTFEIPMDLEIIQKTFLADIQANGAIRIKMRSRYDIDENWAITTSTRVVEYEWIEKPKANVSVITLSIESLANRLIEKNKDQLAENIDIQIQNSINLKKSINDIWYRLRSAMNVSEEYKVWLQMKPLGISVSRLERDGEKVMAYVRASTKPKVVVGKRPIDFKLDSIPKFEWLNADTSGYLIPLNLTIPDSEIADIANAYLADETFDLGKKEIKISDVKIDRVGDRWLVDMNISGDATGRIRMKGKPIFNDKKEKVLLTDFDYEVDSKNILLKSSALLFKQKVEKRLVDQLNEVVEDRKKQVLSIMEEQLLKTNKNQWLNLSNEIDRFTIYDLGLDEYGMWMYVLLSGRIDAQFKYQAAVK